MMVDRRTLEGLDACSPGSDELAQPELAEVAAQLAADPQLAELHRKLHTFDEQVGTALHSTLIPVGLGDRLLARLASETRLSIESGERQTESSDSSSVAVAALVSSATANKSEFAGVNGDPENASSRPAPIVRRVLLVTGGAMAVAAAVLIAVSLGWLRPKSEPLTVANLEPTALDWYDNLTPEWRVKDSARAYPVSARLLPQTRGWQHFSCPSDPKAVAFDLTPQGATHRVTLLVVRAHLPKLAGSPPSRPPVSTLGRMVATWREGDLVYVLVIEGSERLDGLYRRYVDVKNGPIA